MVRTQETGRTEGDGGGGRRYKGVRMRKWGRWVAEIRQPKSRDRIWLGSYNTPEEAGRAYDAAVLCLRGPTAMVNFPWDRPVIPAGELTREQIQAIATGHARRLLSDEVTQPVAASPSFVPVVTAARGGGGREGVDNVVAGGTFYEEPRVRFF